jgi:hypothetical protein
MSTARVLAAWSTACAAGAGSCLSGIASIFGWQPARVPGTGSATAEAAPGGWSIVQMLGAIGEANAGVACIPAARSDRPDRLAR